MKQYIKYKNGIAMVEARYYNYNIQKKKHNQTKSYGIVLWPFAKLTVIIFF